MRVTHEFGPCFDSESEILILGSIPSLKSREVGFYYGHPQNRFWSVLSHVYGKAIGKQQTEKEQFLKEHHIALWDVLESCEIEGSSDLSIQNPIVNDISIIIKASKVRKIYTTGKKAYELYQKYCFPQTHIEAVCLPSTSPANCAWNLEKLVEAYQVLLQ